MDNGIKNSFPSTERHVFVDNGMKNRVPSTERYVFVDNGMKNRVPSTESGQNIQFENDLRIFDIYDKSSP